MPLTETTVFTSLAFGFGTADFSAGALLLAAETLETDASSERHAINSRKSDGRPKHGSLRIAALPATFQRRPRPRLQQKNITASLGEPAPRPPVADFH